MKALDTKDKNLPGLRLYKPEEENLEYLGHFKNPGVLRDGHNTSMTFKAPTMHIMPISPGPVSDFSPSVKKNRGVFPSIGQQLNRTPQQFLGGKPPKRLI